MAAFPPENSQRCGVSTINGSIGASDPRDHNTPVPPQPKDEFVFKFVKP